jgi:hypothetical protein
MSMQDSVCALPERPYCQHGQLFAQVLRDPEMHGLLMLADVNIAGQG